MLTIKNLKITYNELELIKEANFELAPNELILIEGENGSGKSSLLKGIFKYPEYKIENGEMILNGENITPLEINEMARLGMYYGMQAVPEIEGVSTLSFLYKAHKNLNPEKNVSVSDFKKELFELCDKFGLDKDLLSRDLNVGFSGGQKKQADLIHILALKPKYIFLDEPDSGVDKTATQKVYEVINYLREEGAGVALISHSKEAENLNYNRIYKIENNICSQKK